MAVSSLSEKMERWLLKIGRGPLGASPSALVAVKSRARAPPRKRASPAGDAADGVGEEDAGGGCLAIAAAGAFEANAVA